MLFATIDVLRLTDDQLVAIGIHDDGAADQGVVAGVTSPVLSIWRVDTGAKLVDAASLTSSRVSLSGVSETNPGRFSHALGGVVLPEGVDLVARVSATISASTRNFEVRIGRGLA